jgi:Protein of unknown function (DUF3341)
VNAPTEAWGLVAEFESAEALLAAGRHAAASGYRRAEAYSPFPIEGLAEALGFQPRSVPRAAFIGGLLGGIGGFFMQWYSAVVDYPLNIGGRPLNSWPMFVPVTFELTVLCAALAAFITVIVGSRLPDLAHPLFETADFDLATRNRFFLCLRADDPGFDHGHARALLDALKPMRVTEVSR